MKSFKGFLAMGLVAGLAFIGPASRAQGQDYSGNEDPNKKIIKQGLLGAGVGAISAGSSGGKAGQGALIGAGTNVIGGALLDTLTSSPSQSAPQNVQYVQAAPAPVYVQQQPSYPVQPQYQVVEQQPVYYTQEAPPQQNGSQNIIKQGLLGAGVGAISASASGGKAGKGALIGAGTNVIGGALLDTFLAPQPTQNHRIYVQQPPVYTNQAPGYSGQQVTMQTPGTQMVVGGIQPKKKIIRKYDSDGKVVSEVEVWE